MKMLALNLFDIFLCAFFSLRVAPGKLTMKAVTMCRRFIRAFVASCPGSNNVSWKYITLEETLMFLFIELSFFKEWKWPNGEDGIHW